jgi:hypothetical protein
VGEKYAWDPLLPVKGADGHTERLVQACYCPEQPPERHAQAYFRSSTDDGQTWSGAVKVPQWRGVNEVTMIVAQNGDWVAACRTESPKRFAQLAFDHYSGLGVSVSKDEGKSWSDLTMLYEWGRHHPSMVLLPDGRILMSYVVRLGYPDTADGYPQYGIEAVLSPDHGKSWDLDHRYLLVTYRGTRAKKANAWWDAATQGTSSLRMPDGSILTAFGSGHRVNPAPVPGAEAYFPRDIGLVRWKPNQKPVNGDAAISQAAYDSQLRNVFDPQSPDSCLK